MGIVLDIILAGLIIVAFMVGYRKGFVKSVWKIAALVITIILVMILKNPTAEFLTGTSFADTLHTKISESVSVPYGGGVNISDALNLPEFLKPQVSSGIENAGNVITSVNETTANMLTSVFIKIIAGAGLFIVIRLILMAAYMIINGVAKLPVIKGVNKTAGGLLGVINIVFIVFLLLSLVSLFASADSGLFEMINSTYVVKYLYNYNILLQIFMKI